MLKSRLEEWSDEFQDIADKRLKWELIKYNVRKFTISYSSKKKKQTEQFLQQLHERLTTLEDSLGNNPNIKSSDEYNFCKSKINQIEDEIARGAIIRSKIQYLEEGEKCTKFFFDLEKYNYNKKHIRKLKLVDNSTITDEHKILDESAKFYEELYKSQGVSNEKDRIFFNNDMPKLSEQNKLVCDERLSEAECFDVLNSFEAHKTSGIDGLTKDFYTTFWPNISAPLLDSYNYSFQHGYLSVSQRQAVITLLDKGKDKLYLKNWRPVSLLNLDYKILTKLFANRLKEVLPSIIFETQTGYIKNRSIEDAVRLIQDIISHLDINNKPGLLLAIDFQKAFDSIEWSFLLKALKHFNFGEYFIKWVEIFYRDASSCIINNGFTSRYFDINRGVRQGDPLSPYLSIIGIELLSFALRNNPNIKGIKVGDIEYKLTLYADDLTLLLANKESISYATDVFNDFKACSGLQINREKSQGMVLGSLNGNTPNSSFNFKYRLSSKIRRIFYLPK